MNKVYLKPSTPCNSSIAKDGFSRALTHSNSFGSISNARKGIRRRPQTKQISEKFKEILQRLWFKVKLLLTLRVVRKLVSDHV